MMNIQLNMMNTDEKYNVKKWKHEYKKKKKKNRNIKIVM